MSEQPQVTTSTEDLEAYKGDEGEAQRWVIELALAKKETKRFHKVGKEVLRKYRNQFEKEQEQDTDTQSGVMYNLLWSFVETLKPAVYSRIPKPQVERRFKDKDPKGRTAASVLERATTVETVSDSFDRMMKACRDDRLLPGLGQARVDLKSETSMQMVPYTVIQRPDGTFYDGEGNPVDQTLVQENGKGGFQMLQEEMVTTSQHIEYKYINWQDYLWSPARIWDEVRWIAFRSFMTKEEVTRRFGKELAKVIPYKSQPKGLEEHGENKNVQFFSKAIVWEIWDKDTKQVLWLCDGYTSRLLDKKADPFHLKNFFPCPCPLLATHASDSLIPVSDYEYYKRLHLRVEELSEREQLLTEAITVKGVCAREHHDTLQKIFQSPEAEMVPVDRFSLYGEKGLKGVMEFVPVQQIAEVLNHVRAAKDAVLQDIREITAMADIIRGQSDPRTPAKTQQIKSNWVTQRLSERQEEIQRFARDMVALGGELIAEHFEEHILQQMVGLDTMDDEGQQFFSDAVALLRDDPLRSFKISIETDSTIAADDDAEKQRRSEALTAVGQFASQIVPLLQLSPEFAIPAYQLLLFGVRGYRAGRSIEASLEQAVEGIIKQQQEAQDQPPPEPPPDPKMIEVQMKGDIETKKLDIEMQRLALERSKGQADSAQQNYETQVKQMKAEHDYEIKSLKLQLEEQKLRAEQYNSQLQLMQTAQSQQPETPEPEDTEEKAMLQQIMMTLQQMCMGGMGKGESEDKAAVNVIVSSGDKVATFKTDPATGERQAIIQSIGQ